jgi:hypothetical protein
MEYYEKIGRPPSKPAWVNKLISAEYLLYFQHLKFNVNQVWYSETKIDEDFYSRFHDVLERYPRFDLEKDFIHVLLTV